jgi:hypothetical protein
MVPGLADRLLQVLFAGMETKDFLKPTQYWQGLGPAIRSWQLIGEGACIDWQMRLVSRRTHGIVHCITPLLVPVLPRAYAYCCDMCFQLPCPSTSLESALRTTLSAPKHPCYGIRSLSCGTTWMPSACCCANGTCLGVFLHP